MKTETPDPSTPNKEAETYSNLAVVFMIAGMTILAIVGWFINWMIGATWIALVLIAFAFSAHDCAKDARKKAAKGREEA